MLSIHKTIINSATSTGIPLKHWTLSEDIKYKKSSTIQGSTNLEF